MFIFRINKLKILNSHGKREYGWEGPKSAKIKLFSFITTDVISLPELDELMTSNDPDRKKQLFAAVAAKVTSSWSSIEIQNVKDNYQMLFGDTGQALYESDAIPDEFNWTFLAVASGRDVRALGEDIGLVAQNKDFDSFAAQCLKLAGAAANPAYSIAVSILKFAADAFSKSLEEKNDAMVGVVYMSLDRWEHYPHGERKADDVVDLTNNMYVDYSIFGIEKGADAGHS